MLAKLVVAAGMSCPGSAAWLHHAQCQVTVRFVENCTVVYGEMVARVEGQNGWEDPHNHGTYIFADPARGPGSVPGKVLAADRQTGGGPHPTSLHQYMDKLLLTFTQEDGLGVAPCLVEACSESQVTSLLDMGTNYCNLHDLWAGAPDRLPVAHTQLTYAEEVGSCTNSDKTKCHGATAALAESDPIRDMEGGGRPGHMMPGAPPAVALAESDPIRDMEGGGRPGHMMPGAPPAAALAESDPIRDMEGGGRPGHMMPGALLAGPSTVLASEPDACCGLCHPDEGCLDCDPYDGPLDGRRVSCPVGGCAPTCPGRQLVV